MKFFIASVITLASIQSFASGYLCEGVDSENHTYRVKLYNEVDPGAGTKNPAALIVSTPTVGTIATVKGQDIAKINGERAVTFSGISHDYHTGRYVSVQLVIAKAAQAGGKNHFGRLSLAADHVQVDAKLSCAYVLKGNN